MSAQTVAGIMTSNITTAISSEIRDRFNQVLVGWQAAENEKHYVRKGVTFPTDQCHGTFGTKYARLDIGGSGAFMVDIASGIIYQIMGYGKVDKKKNIGNIYDPNFDAGVLVRDRFRYGRFVNNPDGSIPAGAQVKR